MNITHPGFSIRWPLIIVFLALGLYGCNSKPPPAPTDTPLPPTAVSITPTNAEILPSATAAPTLPSVALAAVVNGWAITQAEYEAELALYQSTLAAEDSEALANAHQHVLDDLIAQALLAQAAWQAGYRVDDPVLQARIDQLVSQLGSPQILNDWISANGYTEETFRWTLQRSMAAAWMRDQITNAVPTVAEQIHARQILLYNSDEANTVLLQLKNGANFADLAFQYDPAAGGDLGWFPQGCLTTPEVETAAFALQADQFSEVIQSPLGYHIIQVIAIETQHELVPATHLCLQELALINWITEQRAQGNIEIRIP